MFLCIFSDPSKKRSFLCSIICCLGKRSSSGKKSKDKEHGGNGANAGHATDSGHLGRDAADNSKPPKAPQKALLPDIRPEEADKKCIVIDLDETLVHSSFKVNYLYERSELRLFPNKPV